MVTVIVRHGMWKAKCVCYEQMGGAEHYEWVPGRPRFTGLDRDWFRCSTCGYHTTDVRWPDSGADIARVLSVRPTLNQNWEPPETIHDLITENVMHGCVPTAGIDSGPLIV